MKKAVFVASLLAPLSSWAQQYAAIASPTITLKLNSPAALYCDLHDTTTTQTAVRLHPGDKITLVGIVDSYWMAVRRSQKPPSRTPTVYFIRLDETTDAEVASQ